ncbi:MAG: hypothetical protein FWH35_05955 [Treponema sp.]|nr:hypothetical protein [Treponema sp.]
MSFFCLFWVPLFYLFRRSVTGSKNGAGGIWALLLGIIIAIIHFFLGAFINPEGFGFIRWMSGFIDIVSLPVLIPIIVYFCLIYFKIITGTADFANFTLLWLIPGASLRGLTMSSQSDPVFLVLVPFLWTAISVGIPFFIDIILNSKVLVIVLSCLAVLCIPFSAASSYWAFYSQKTVLGFLFLLAAAAPMVVSMTISFIRGDG